MRTSNGAGRSRPERPASPTDHATTAQPSGAAPARATKGSDGAAYALMLEVERYESLAEDMEELDVVSLADLRLKIADLHRKLDDLG
ncbi:MAG: hypothetical protein ACR2JY_19550 [Chloroflexota bacterium]